MKIVKNFELPNTYEAAFLQKPNAALHIQTQNISALKPNEVWVKMHAAPIHPADLAMLAGTYPHQKTYPFTPGLEGSGTVVASGGGWLANRVLGKKVACTAPETGNGTWAEYMRAPASKCIELPNKISLTEGATALVNPLTAMVLHRKATAMGGAYVNTAAGGSLGQMLLKLAKNDKQAVLHIVRDDNQRETLRAAGAAYVLDSSAANFDAEYAALCEKIKVRTILDAIGGTFSNILLTGAPEDTKLIAYASLSRADICVQPQQIIRFHKTVSGFHLGTWMAKKSLFQKIVLVNRTFKNIANGTLQTKIYNTAPLKDINSLVAEYQSNMAAGKRLVVF